MFNNKKVRTIIFLSTCLFTGMTQAADTTISEIELNNPISSAQELSSPADVSVQAYLGNAGSSDLDYYTFYANAGDVITVDIDNGIGGTKSVDTVLAIFDSSPAHTILRFNDDASSIDPGSISRLDARIDDFVAPVSGFYIVGVSNYPRYFVDGGGVINASYPAQGDYTLVISGVTAAVKQVPIQIMPGNTNTAPVNPRSHGKIPVAILSEPGFDPMTIKRSTLTFGSSGYETSLSKCNPEGVDLNGDGEPDLLCHFSAEKAQFKTSDAEGTVRGQTRDGTQFKGTGYLKIVPMKGVIH